LVSFSILSVLIKGSFNLYSNNLINLLNINLAIIKLSFEFK